MQSLDSLPAKCRRALEEVETLKASQTEIQQLAEVSQDSIFYRLFTEHDLTDAGNIATTLFQQQDLSVYASHSSLPALDPTELKLNPAVIGFVAIRANVFWSNEQLKALRIVHDPFKDPNGYIHPNHVRIVCGKNVKAAQAILSAMDECRRFA